MAEYLFVRRFTSPTEEAAADFAADLLAVVPTEPEIRRGRTSLSQVWRSGDDEEYRLLAEPAMTHEQLAMYRERES